MLKVKKLDNENIENLIELMLKDLKIELRKDNADDIIKDIIK